MNQVQPKPHELHVEQFSEAIVIRPEGACDRECAEALDGLVSRIEGEPQKNVILDASRLRYIETPGFRWIIEQFRKLQDRGGSLVIAGLKGSAERAFRLLQLDKFIPAASTVEAALARIRRSREERWSRSVKTGTED